MSEEELRFAGVSRLVGSEGLDRLGRAHVAVIGIGGVGSWAIEALARSGVGELTLVDLDEVCVSNINRQLHALDTTLGQSKVQLMSERIRSIHPNCQVREVMDFFTESNAEEMMGPGFDFVVDAIDAVPAKCALLGACLKRGVPVVSCGAAGGRTDATAVRIAELSRVSHDRLLGQVRRRLRESAGSLVCGVEGGPGIACVFSTERVRQPEACSSRPLSSEGGGPGLNCNQGLGSLCSVTGTFGFAAAGHVIRELALGRKVSGGSEKPAKKL